MIDLMLIPALEEFLGTLRQLFTNILGHDREMWGKEFKKFVRQEPSWAPAVHDVPSHSRTIYPRMDVAPTVGNEFLGATKVFRKIREHGFFDGTSENPTYGAKMKVEEVIHNHALLLNAFEKVGIRFPGEGFWTRSQLTLICEKYGSILAEGCRNFFPTERGLARVTFEEGEPVLDTYDFGPDFRDIRLGLRDRMFIRK